MSDLVEGQVGEIKYDLAFVNGKLKLSGDFANGGLDVGLSVSLDAGVFLDKLKAVIPGSIDDAIIDGLKKALLPNSEAPQA